MCSHNAAAAARIHTCTARVYTHTHTHRRMHTHAVYTMEPAWAVCCPPPHLVHVLGHVAGQQVDGAAPRLVPAQRRIVLQPVAAAVHVHRQVAHIAGRVHALRQHNTTHSTQHSKVMRKGADTADWA
jgi:xanthosine utilization system XapX-like protein